MTAVYPRFLAHRAGTRYFINNCLRYSVIVKCVDSGVRLTKFKYRALIYFSYMILGKQFLYLNFLICKMGLIVPISHETVKVKCVDIDNTFRIAPITH